MDYIKRIKEIKSARKMTNDELAERTGIPGGTLAKILAGISESPKLCNIVAICEALNCSLDYIMYGVEENKKNLERQWLALDTFSRYSNISASDYHSVQLKMIAAQGWGEPLESSQIELLANLEHIRWCRYHYLNNWTYGSPENGKNKDMDRRIHMCLRPYESLADEEREKDRMNVSLLLQLDKES